MGNSQSIQKINFEDMQNVIKNPEIYLLINTLPESEQNCLIPNTIAPVQEETMINTFLQKRIKEIRIVIYGRNSNDDKIYEKYNQLLKLGFYNIFLYTGGLFEWLMLQDIYGFNEFPTTSKQLDFLKYKPKQVLNVGLLKY
uniref:Rhodanese domain-containing protein n=1 Tax=viral metagenome TaxID=1070528 RepID=A0A6C0DH08_9ZZZZ